MNRTIRTQFPEKSAFGTEFWTEVLFVYPTSTSAGYLHRIIRKTNCTNHKVNYLINL